MIITKEYIQKYNPNLVIEDEIWVPLFGYEGILEVSTYGNIRRLPHYCTYTRLGKSVTKFFDTSIYSVHFSIEGYPKCVVPNNKEISCHRAIALSFLSRPDNYDQMEVDHIDYTPQNCYYKNLQWVTPKENKARSYTHVLQKNRQLIRDIKSGKVYSSILSFCNLNNYIVDVVSYGIYKLNGYIPKYDACIEYYPGKFEDVGSIQRYSTDDNKIFELRAAHVRRYRHKGVRCITTHEVFLNALTASKSLGLPSACVSEVLEKFNGVYKKNNLMFEYIDWKFASDSDIIAVIPHFISINSKAHGRYSKDV